MANLINVFYFLGGDDLPTTNLIPGEVFITGDFNDSPVINPSTMEYLYIVDMHRRLIRVSKWCRKCNAFHIENNKYHKLLGRHWEKYKMVHFMKLRIPITKVCNYSENSPPGSRIQDPGSGIQDFQILYT
jgi:hypothetical protein